MFADRELRARKTVCLREAENHHAIGRLQAKKVKIGKVADQAHGRSMPVGEQITCLLYTSDAADD